MARLPRHSHSILMRAAPDLGYDQLAKELGTERSLRDDGPQICKSEFDRIAKLLNETHGFAVEITDRQAETLRFELLCIRGDWLSSKDGTEKGTVIRHLRDLVSAVDAITEVTATYREVSSRQS